MLWYGRYSTHVTNVTCACGTDNDPVVTVGQQLERSGRTVDHGRVGGWAK